jgi:hypothetical protein
MALTALQHLQWQFDRPRWHRRTLRQVLTPGLVLALGDEIDRERWSNVQIALVEILKARSAGFILDPATRQPLKDEILCRWPDAAPDAAARGERLLGGHYDVLGYRGLAFADSAGQVDWHFDPVHKRRPGRHFWANEPYLDPTHGDHKIIWELNRHQHWLQLGRALWLTDDPRFGSAIVAQLEGWLAANPPLTGINWASMLEIALRSISWIWALHFLLADERPGVSRLPSTTRDRPWLVDMLVGLDRHLRHVEQNLSYYFSPNTHLTGEALALYVVGSALPELRSSPRWVETGRRILLREIDRQICLDGGHAERSTHYQRYTLDFYLLALLTAMHGEDEDAASRFRDAVGRLSEFTRAIADDEGRLPLIGDDDGGMLWPIRGRDCNDVRDSLALAGVLLQRPDLAPWGVPEEVFWIAREWASRTPDAQRGVAATSAATTVFPETGYWIGRNDAGGHLVFDVGAHGFLNGGHAHADALAITLAARGRPLLIDPGTSTYTMDPLLRDRLRSSVCHNTVTVDNRSQSIPDGPFHWRSRADARLHGCRSNSAFDWVEASHDGYAPLVHRRSVVRTGRDGWLVVDEILGSGCHNANVNWHFEPDWHVSSDSPGRLRAEHQDGDVAWLLQEGDVFLLAHGDNEAGVGWYAPVYGTLIPTWTARAWRLAEAPFSLVTWIATPVVDSALPTLARVSVNVEHDQTAMATRLTSGPRRAIVMLQPGVGSTDDIGACGVGGYQTNARVLHCVTLSDELQTLDLVDASHAWSLRQGWLSVAGDDRISDLHVGVESGSLRLTASIPPALLRLQGKVVNDAYSIRLNGRELRPAVAADRTLVLLADQWGEPRNEFVRNEMLPQPTCAGARSC